MDTTALKKFAQKARRQLLEQVGTRLEQVLRSDSVEIREKADVVKALESEISRTSKEAVIEFVAYTWFNRLCALRYMDVNRYTRMGIVSPQEGYTQPEILQESKQGVIDDAFKVDKKQVIGLLNGELPAANPQQEAYRLLLVGACNAYHAQMPFLFPKINDYTELLMSADLLSESSVLHDVRETLTAKNCKDVEVIGWLYQFYISEKKDQVMARKSAVPTEDIPAVTQLFTPHWIVRYLVENSLGRLWMLNHPDSNLVEQMEYYIKPEQEEEDYLQISSPEEIKVCDPACGSGHMLTYAFDLLYKIYALQGYDPLQIPSLIIEKNLYGVEIDERAGQLAAFALMMKGREKDRRFFSRDIDPNICVMENVNFIASEIKTYMEKVGSDLLTQDLWEGLQQFEDAKTFGSLIRPIIKNPQEILNRMKERGAFKDLILFGTNQKVGKVLEMVTYLNPCYHVAVTNPPYMGTGGMNEELRNYAKDQYPNSKTDLGVMFIDRNLNIVKQKGLIGVITLQNWMFRSTYKNFRKNLIKISQIETMAHLGTRAFDTISGEVVSTTAFILSNNENYRTCGIYFRLVDGSNELEKKQKLLDSIPKDYQHIPANCFLVSTKNFGQVPGSPILYWASKPILNCFKKNQIIGRFVDTREGLTTGSNETFLRFWFENNLSNICFSSESEKDAIGSKVRWFPIVKGGTFRKWYGNFDYVVDWERNGKRIKNFTDKNTGRVRSHNYNGSFAFKTGFTWSIISSGSFAVRHVPTGFMFDTSGPMGFSNSISDLPVIESFLNSQVSIVLMSMLAPTLDYKLGHVLNLPFNNQFDSRIRVIADKNISLLKKDWDSFETSWEFLSSPLLDDGNNLERLIDTYKLVKVSWNSQIQLVKELEEENNRIFIEAYSLEDELSPEVSLEEITLTCNSHYRYKGDKTEEELEALLLSGTMKEFISYAVGCILGRYSLDKEGLILANAGETLQDYLRQVQEPSFMPDEDNVIPVLEEEWFEDDIAERFKDFLKVTFGEANFEENLSFLEEAIGRDIRSYFVKDFYKHHVRMYKKRPIYWLFSSPKGSFNVLIYMHRYQPDTLSIILNDYLVQYREKLGAHKSLLENRSISANASQGEKSKAVKEIDKINKILSELKEYEAEILYPLATQQIEIDLDDGVKVNYKKFGKALRKVTGLSEAK